MRKLVLDLDALEVESFEASGGGEEAGTVRGHELSHTLCPTNCLSDPCFCHLSEAGCG